MLTELLDSNNPDKYTHFILFFDGWEQLRGIYNTYHAALLRSLLRIENLYVPRLQDVNHYQLNLNI